MDELDAFLEKDIPLFLDTFEQTKVKHVASEDEINKLLSHDYQKRVRSALTQGSFQHIPTQDFPFIKTLNIFESHAPIMAQEVHVSDSASTQVDHMSVESANITAESATVQSPEVVSEQDVETIIPEDKRDDPTFDPKSLLRTLGSTRKEDLGNYVRAIIALEDKDKQEAVSLFYSLAHKYPRNIAFRIRLQDALLLPGEAIVLPSLPKASRSTKKVSNESLAKTETSKSDPVQEVNEEPKEDYKKPKQSNFDKKPVSKETSTITQEIKDPYQKALQAIKEGDKDSAVNLLKDLIRSKPNNLAFRLRLQEALEL